MDSQIATDKPLIVKLTPNTADVAAVARTLIESLVTTAPPRDREVEAARAKARAAERFGNDPRGA